MVIKKEGIVPTAVECSLGLRRHDISSGVSQTVLMHALQLRRSYRDVFILCDLQKHSIHEAATILASTPRAVQKRLTGARREMQEVVARVCAQIYGPHHKALTLADVVASCNAMQPLEESDSMQFLQASPLRAAAARA